MMRKHSWTGGIQTIEEDGSFTFIRPQTPLMKCFSANIRQGSPYRHFLRKTPDTILGQLKDDVLHPLWDCSFAPGTENGLLNIKIEELTRVKHGTERICASLQPIGITQVVNGLFQDPLFELL